MKDFSTFIGMDVHKETIAVAIAEKHGTHCTMARLRTRLRQ
jgi:hypothetical protein